MHKCVLDSQYLALYLSPNCCLFVLEEMNKKYLRRRPRLDYIKRMKVIYEYSSENKNILVLIGRITLNNAKKNKKKIKKRISPGLAVNRTRDLTHPKRESYH